MSHCAYLSIQADNGYENDFLIHLILWGYMIYISEIKECTRVYMDPFMGKQMSYFFEVPEYIKTTNAIENREIYDFKIKSISHIHALKNKLSDVLEHIIKIIKSFIPNEHIKEQVDLYQNINILNTQFYTTKSLYMNAIHDPELYRTNIYECIEPGNELLIYKNDGMYNLIFLNDMYNIKTINTENSCAKCIETLILLNGVYRKYHCSCKDYSTIHIFGLI